MKTIFFLLVMGMGVTGCNGWHKYSDSDNKIINKIPRRSGLQEIDTLWVSQNDTAVFSSEELIQRYPDRNARLGLRYELRNPQDEMYYFIYNDKQQLVQEGKYTAQYIYEGIIYDRNFYNTKRYFYKKNGRLNSVHYQEDGRNFKLEQFAKDGQLTKITYFNKKTGEKEKIEIYKNKKLKETRIYTAFKTYRTVKSF